MWKELLLAPAFVVFAIGAISAGAIKFYRWALNRGRKQVIANVTDTFVYEVAVNHLPHVYDALKLIAARLDVELPEPPPIKFIPHEPKG